MSAKNFWTATISAWIVFIGVDFLFHASILQSMWSEDVEGIKSQLELFQLIPAGYTSFLILTLLVGFLYTAIFKAPGSLQQSMSFGLVFAGLYSVGNMLGTYSYATIPLDYLVVFNAVYFVEIMVIVFVFHKTMHTDRLRKILTYSLAAFFALVVLGIILQNLA